MTDITRRVALAAIPAVAAATALPALASGTDPLVELRRRQLEAERESNRLYEEIEMAGQVRDALHSALSAILNDGGSVDFSRFGAGHYITLSAEPA